MRRRLSLSNSRTIATNLNAAPSSVNINITNRNKGSSSLSFCSNSDTCTVVTTMTEATNSSSGCKMVHFGSFHVEEVQRIPYRYYDDYFYELPDLQESHRQDVSAIQKALKIAEQVHGKDEYHYDLVESDAFTWRGIEDYKSHSHLTKKEHAKAHRTRVLKEWARLQQQCHNQLQHDTNIKIEEQLRNFAKASSKVDRQVAQKRAHADAKEQGYKDKPTAASTGIRIRKTISNSFAKLSSNTKKGHDHHQHQQKHKQPLRRTKTTDSSWQPNQNQQQQQGKRMSDYSHSNTLQEFVV